MSRLHPPFRSVLDLIGETPVVELTQFDTGPCRLFIKLESQNPGGSIKDRIALSMIAAAEREGKLKRGGTIVEATAGNTGLGLAQVGIPKGYRIILVVPDKMSREKIQHLRALGAEVRLTRSDVGKGHPEYYQDMAEKIASEIPGSFYVNQFANPANPQAHETTTGPEIWDQLDGDVDAVVVGVGSGGTLTGLGRFFAKVSPKTEMVLADPVGSVLAPLVKTGKMEEAGSWTVEGIGEDFVPPNADLSLVKKAYSVNDKASMLAVRDLLAKEGILAGSSSGTLLSAALRYCREQKTPKRVVTFVCDSGNKYLSKVFDDFWLAEQGLAEKEQHGDLSDLVARSHREGGTVFVGRRTICSPPMAGCGAGTCRSCRCWRTASSSASSTRATSCPRSTDPMTAAGTASTRRCRRPWPRTCTRCRPTRRWTRCCRSSTATKWRSCSTATNSSG
ncbi:cystathionine beta-synthase [Aminobacter aganoensis]|uniref:Cysteine synthase B n=1 Tax=Aminobacter aganoensis TaxID=83264 RepID=A0A7X0KM99_9HYPH|nr:cystathionine beta-synthase [Aminobacter aganoensis]